MAKLSPTVHMLYVLGDTQHLLHMCVFRGLVLPEVPIDIGAPQGATSTPQIRQVTWGGGPKEG